MLPPIDKIEYPQARRRASLKFIVFNILTCGIYSLFFIYYVIKDLNLIARQLGLRKVPGLFKLIVFTLLTGGIYYFYWLYRLGSCIVDISNVVIYIDRDCTKKSTLLFWNTIGLLFCGLGPLVSLGYICRDADTLALFFRDYVLQSPEFAAYVNLSQ